MAGLPPNLTYALADLGLESLPGAVELKKKWRALIKENHPDLFPEALKKTQEEKIRSINLAYRSLAANRSADGPALPKQKTSKKPRHCVFNPKGNEAALHTDPVYAWYKRGFRLYSEAVGGIHAKWMRNKSFRGKALELFLKRLGLLWEARSYFQRVITEEPESVWVRDASYKLWRIEQFTRVYSRIRENLAARRRA